MTVSKKKQHYVPRCYLEAFSDSSSNRVWVLSVKEKKIFQQTPENILSGNYIYTIKLASGGGSHVVEDTLANIEGRYASIYREKISKELRLNPEEKGILAVFAAAMMTRTKRQREHLVDFIDRVREKMIALEKAHNVAPSKARQELEGIRDTAPQEIMIANLPELSRIVFNMKFCIVSPKNKEERFLTSSNPFVLFNPVLVAEYGLGSIYASPGLAQKNVELSLPLSPNKALCAGWELRVDGLYIDIPTELVKGINVRSTMYTDEYVVASSKEQLEEVLTHLRK